MSAGNGKMKTQRENIECELHICGKLHPMSTSQQKVQEKKKRKNAGDIRETAV